MSYDIAGVQLPVFEHYQDGVDSKYTGLKINDHMHLYGPCCEKTCPGFWTKSNTNQTVQPQAKSLKFYT